MGVKELLTHSWLLGFLEPFSGGMVAVSKGPASALGSEELSEGENSESPRCCCYKRSDAGGPARIQRRFRKMRTTSADLSFVQLLGHRKTFKTFI